MWLMVYWRLFLVNERLVVKLHGMYRIAWTDHGMAPSFGFSMALDGFD